jgi:1,4-alpha-glucan branching enzyme
MKKWWMLIGVMFFWIAGFTGPFYRVQNEKVTFYLKLSDAQQVDFAYSHDEYRLHKLKKEKSGAWEITVPAHPEFRYFFVVDGVVYLPDCKYRETDDFGSENCIFMPPR